MFIYVSMMIWTAICGIIGKSSEKNYVLEGRTEKRSSHIFAVLTMAYIVLFMGLFCGHFDLPAYELGFAQVPSEPAEFSDYMQTVEKYPGFYGLQALFKSYISTEFYHWTLFTVSFNCIVIAYFFRKYSSSFAFSVFLFIASGRIFWMVNGVKQFFATCIILAFSKALMEKKFWLYAVGVIIASFFHTSALVALPVYFFVHGKPWNKKMLLILVGTVLSITFLSTFTGILGSVLEAVDYNSSYATAMESGKGSSILHFLIAAVPAVIALISRKRIEGLTPSYINVCINMSIITACLYLMATFTSGILMGRMPIYFQLYSFISLPWLLNNAFDKETGDSLKLTCVICYLIQYYLVFWKTPYYSIVLDIYITP